MNNSKPYPNEDVDALCETHPNLRLLLREAAAASSAVSELRAKLERALARYAAADGAAHAYRQEIQRQRDERERP